MRFPFSIFRFIPAPAGNGLTSVAMRATLQVHPRACGERVDLPHGVARGVGSSPRLRGTVDSLLLLDEAERFIPAPAGNGRSGSPTTPPASVHPRACGERTTFWMPSFQSDGSSPRLRGTVRIWARLLAIRRFIPAPAGNGRLGHLIE